MTDPLNGLRFDIYERVHLTDDVAAIEELEEIELIPRMQAIPQEDQVLLRGHLLLTGIYRSQHSEELSQLEHWIPVEISLPLNRIHSVEDLAVEIDNFDVDLLTSRSLNVTGVLALRGLEIEAPQVPVWRDDSFTVVHQSLSDANHSTEQVEEVNELTSPVSGLYAFQEQVNLAESDVGRFAQTSPQELSSIWGDISGQQRNAEALSAESITAESISKSEDSNSNLVDANATSNITAEAISEGDRIKLLPPEPLISESSNLEKIAEKGPEKFELKVALGGMPLDPANRIQSGVGLLSQLGDMGAKREAELKVLEAIKVEEAALAATNNPAGITGDELEWTRLFLSSGAEAHTFRKVKMCIVQREDTLDGIANRYNIQSRELQLHNRLIDPYLSEGQVLYIP